MFKTAIKEELCQISLTGMRALVLLGLLMDAPRSLDDIRQEFIKFNIMEDENSDDILRIDLNTLRAMGCEISRSSQKTNNKYQLISHPFALDITKEEISALSKAYNKIKNSLDLGKLIGYHNLFEKIGGYINDKELREQMYGISILKSFDMQTILDLQKDCKAKRVVSLIYRSPVAKEEHEKEITVEKLVFKNDKVYLYGYDHKLKESVTLNVKRILSILSRKKSDEEYESKSVAVKFILKEFGAAGLEDTENIVEKTENGYLVEGKYFNEFLAKQRMLSFGSSCTILEPDDLREKVIELLKQMKEIYND